MLLSGYISGDCIYLYQDIFQEIAYAYTGYISGDCICLYQDIFQEIAYAYIENKNEKITAAWLQDGEYQIGEIRWGVGTFPNGPLRVK